MQSLSEQLTYTRPLVGMDTVSWGTSTPVAACSVGTVVLTPLALSTLIYIYNYTENLQDLLTFHFVLC